MHRRTLLHHKIRCATHVYKDLFECNFTVNILNICIICQPENQISLKSKVRMILGTTKKQPCIMRRQWMQFILRFNRLTINYFLKSSIITPSYTTLKDKSSCIVLGARVIEIHAIGVWWHTIIFMVGRVWFIGCLWRFSPFSVDSQVIDSSCLNKMTASNLAVVFAPNLIRSGLVSNSVSFAS